MRSTVKRINKKMSQNKTKFIYFFYCAAPFKLPVILTRRALPGTIF